MQINCQTYTQIMVLHSASSCRLRKQREAVWHEQVSALNVTILITDTFPIYEFFIYYTWSEKMVNVWCGMWPRIWCCAAHNCEMSRLCAVQWTHLCTDKESHHKYYIFWWQLPRWIAFSVHKTGTRQMNYSFGLNPHAHPSGETRHTFIESVYLNYPPTCFF